MGQTAGYYVGGTFFIILESAQFCNSYIRPVFGLPSQEHGVIDISMFFYFFGAVFSSTAVIIFQFKSEKSKTSIKEEEEEEEQQQQQEENQISASTSNVPAQVETDVKNNGLSLINLSLFKSYKIIWHLFKLNSIRMMALILLTMNVK